MEVRQNREFLFVDFGEFVKVIGYLGNSQPVIIPETIENKPVTIIGAREWESVTLAEEMLIPKTVREIEIAALMFGTSKHWICGLNIDPGNPYLEIYDDVLYTKGRARALFNLGSNEREEYVLPKETIEVAEHAFEDTFLKRIVFNEVLRKIEKCAFRGNWFNKVNIPETVEWIGDEAFYSESSVVVLSDRTIIGNNIATNIEISKSNQNYVMNGSMLLSADGKRILKYIGDGYDTDITIPDTVEIIDDNAFETAINLTRIKLSQNLKSIGKEAFRYTQIKSVHLPDEVQYISADAFSENRPRTKITLGKKSKYFRDDGVAIYHLEEDGSETIVKIIDKNITEYTVPEKVKVLKGEVFEGCRKLSKLILPEGLEYFDENCIYELDYGTENKVKTIRIPASVKTIKLIGRQYSDSGSTKYIVDEKNEYYFVDDDVLYAVNGDNDYTALCGQNPKSKIVELVEGTTSIAPYAFSPSYAEKYSNLKQLILPDSLKVIGESAFSETAINRLQLPNNLRLIAGNAFANCEKLETVFISEHVELVADNAFSGCTNITKFDVVKNNKKYTSIEGVLFTKDRLKLIGYPFGIKQKKYSVPEGTHFIGKTFFYSKYLRELVLPKSLESLGMDAISGSIRDVYIQNDFVVIDRFAFGFESDLIKLHCTMNSTTARFVEKAIEDGRTNVELINDSESEEIKVIK